MATPAADAERWLAAARAGSPEALGQALDACRGYLLAVAGRELDPALRAKGGASDIVQETLLDACRDFDRFHGTSADELLAWLHRIMHNNLIEFVRRFRGADKRDVRREVALPGGDSSEAPGAGVAAGTATPSAQASAREQSEALRQAVERLPEDYRRVIALRYTEKRSFEEIGQTLGLSANAARKLWLRATQRLRIEGVGPP